MSLENRVRKLEDEIGEVVVCFRHIFGGVFYGDCKRYQEETCQRINKNKPMNVSEGKKLKFVSAPHTSDAKNPCEGCRDAKVSSIEEREEK
jgi:hypothetical protein